MNSKTTKKITGDEAKKVSGGYTDINKKMCIGCGECVTACPLAIIDMVDGYARIRRDNTTPECLTCGNCSLVCPAGAIIES